MTIYRYQLYISHILHNTDINIVAVKNISCKNCTGSDRESQASAFFQIIALKSNLHCQFTNLSHAQSMPRVAEGSAFAILIILPNQRTIAINAHSTYLIIFFIIYILVKNKLYTQIIFIKSKKSNL